MRTTIAIVLSLGLFACSNGAEEGAEAARKQAEKEQKEKAAAGSVAKKISPPVPGRAKLDCANVIDAELFQQALGEAEPVTVVESKSEPDAAASCSILRGGKRLTEAEQKAKLKKEGRLGVMAGDEICNVSAFCWTIEDPDRFRRKCAELKNQGDESLGFYSCVQIVAQGADDVKRFRFYDDDTKCIIQVRGGPSNVDNDLIGKCAKAAHDLIGPDQIKVGAAPAAPASSAAPAAGDESETSTAVSPAPPERLSFRDAVCAGREVFLARLRSVMPARPAPEAPGSWELPLKYEIEAVLSGRTDESPRRGQTQVLVMPFTVADSDKLDAAPKPEAVRAAMERQVDRGLRQLGRRYLLQPGGPFEGSRWTGPVASITHEDRWVDAALRAASRLGGQPKGWPSGSGVCGEHPWRVTCDRDGLCVLEARGVRLAPEWRGRLSCTGKDAWLACLYTHTTHLHRQSLWFVHLSTGRVEPVKIPSGMDATGTLTYLSDPPRWTEDGRVEFRLMDGPSRLWRVAPPAAPSE